MICKNCKQTIKEKDLVETLQRMVNGKFHVRGECPICRSWVKFIPFKKSYTIINSLHGIYRNEDIQSLYEKITVIDDKNETII